MATIVAPSNMQRPPAEAMRAQPTGMQGEDDAARAYLQFVYGVLRRRKWFVLSFVALVACVAGVLVARITPRYAAVTEVVVEPSRPAMPGGLQALTGGLQTDFYTNETEAAVITSLGLAELVIDKLKLAANPWFNEEARKQVYGPGLIPLALSQVWRILPDMAKPYVGFLQPDTSRATGQVNMNRVLEIYYESLTAKSSDRSRVLTVKFVSHDPKLSADIVNTVADTYIQQQIARRQAQASSETIWLADRVTEMRERVIDSQKKLEEARVSAGLTEPGGTRALERSITEFNQQLVQAQIRRAEFESRVRQTNSAIARGGGGAGVEGAPAVLESPMVQRLRDAEALAQRKVAELRTQYREGHPKMELALAEMRDIRHSLSVEVRTVAESMATQLRISQEHEAALGGTIRKMSDELVKMATAEAAVRTLEVEYKTNTQLFETLLNRLREATVVEERTKQADARVISRAVPPEMPFYPNKPMMVGAAIGLGLLAAIGLAFVLEFLDAGFRNLRQIELLTGLEPIGVVPKLRARVTKMKPHIVLKRRTNSVFAESIRSARVALTLDTFDRQPFVMLVSSSVPGEGKSFSAALMATSFATAGHRVVVIDCDLRNPTVEKMLGVRSDGPGLTQYLQGKAKLEDVVMTEADTGIDYVRAGQTSGQIDPPVLLGSRRMELLIEELRGVYDAIIIDSPPVMLVSDALILQRYVDRVLFVVRWGKTRREIVLNALKQISLKEPHKIGLLMTQVDTKRQEQYDYAHPAQSQYGSYYGSQGKSNALALVDPREDRRLAG